MMAIRTPEKLDCNRTPVPISRHSRCASLLHRAFHHWHPSTAHLRGLWHTDIVDLVMIYTDSFKDDTNFLLARMERVRPNVYTYPPQVKDW